LLQVGLEKTQPGAATQSTPGVPASPAPEPAEIAADFPQLEILELLGQGGMGVVYKARQKSLDRMVALKLLNVPASAGPDFAERFTREARALASLSHSSIVTVYDFGRAGERYYLLMEYVDGPDLHRLIRGGEIAPRQALEMVSHICDALQFAHESGVVHRDIKPENILVDKKGRVKIADFGLAKILDRPADTTRLTGAHQVMGTAHYMAPEQLERPLDVDHRADIYSLGVVFYELLTGELPIGRFQPPSRKIEVDVRIDDVVLKTLEKEPQLRYQHASDLKTDVDGITGSVGTGAPAAAGVHSTAQTVTHTWGPWVIGGSTLLVLAGMVAVLLVITGFITFRNGPVEAGGSGASVESAAPVAQSGKSVGSRERKATPALAIAAARGDLAIVNSLLDAGADVNEQDSDGWSALIGAVDRGHAEIARLLLDRGADANAARQSGVTALIIAASRGDQQTVEMLLSHEAEVNAQDTDGWSALTAAADRGHFEIARLLLDRGADVNAARQSGMTSLIVAASRGDQMLVKTLLDHGADVNAQDTDGWSALTAAADRGHIEIVRLLLDRGADVNAARQSGVTSLIVAAARGDLALVQLLLDHGARVNTQDTDGTTALGAAVDRGHAEIVELLLARGGR
jgi:ankyrin repeat protein/predicted Ser/Thr protein kinase